MHSLRKYYGSTLHPRYRSSARARMLAVMLPALALAFTCDRVLAADYAVKHKFAIEGEDGWDYLTYDARANRLFISRGTHVQVIDPDRGVVIGDIADTSGVHGIALADDLGKGFTSNGRDNSVTVFDLTTLKTIARIKTEGGEDPDFIAYDSMSRRIFAFNGRSHNASVIDAGALTLVATIPLDGKPEAAVPDGKGTMFVNIEDKNEIAVLDTRRAVAINSWPVTGCQEPAALAIDKEGRKLFAGCHNKVVAIVDADSGKVIQTLPIGGGVDAGVFDAATKLAFSAEGEGTVTIVKETSSGRYAIVQTVATQPGARTLALNPNSHDLYLVSAEFNEAPSAGGQQRTRRSVKAGSFTLLVIGSAD